MRGRREEDVNEGLIMVMVGGARTAGNIYSRGRAAILVPLI